MNHHQSNLISILGGCFLGMVRAILSIQLYDFGVEALRVFLFGIIGGIGGYLGKIIIDFIIAQLKK